MAQTTKHTEHEAHDKTDASGGRVAELTDSARGVVENAREMAGELAAQLPSAAATTKAAMDEANRQMESTSDIVLTLGATFAFGVTLGLFLSGTNRVAVAAALIPAVAMSMTVVDRRSRGSLDSYITSKS